MKQSQRKGKTAVQFCRSVVAIQHHLFLSFPFVAIQLPANTPRHSSAWFKPHSNETRLEPQPAYTKKQHSPCQEWRGILSACHFRPWLRHASSLRAAALSGQCLGKVEKKRKFQINSGCRHGCQGCQAMCLLCCVAGVCTCQNSVESCEYQPVWDIDQQPCLDPYMTDVKGKHNSAPRCKDLKGERRTSVKFYFNSRGSSSCVKTDTQLCDLFFFSFFLFFSIIYFTWFKSCAF